MKQTKHGHLKREFSCHIQDLSNFGQPPQPCTNQQSSTYMPLTHWFPSRGPEPISLVFRQSPCLNLQWPSKTFIHPPRMTMTDLATKRSICIPFSFFFFSLSLPLSLCPLHFILVLFCWCAEYDEKVRVQILVACENNNAITIWPWRTVNSSVHLSIYLTHVTFHFSESQQIIHANIK